MGAFDNDSSIEGDVYIQRLASYIRRNEEALANGLLSFSKVRTSSKVKPLRPSFTTHHLYYLTERIANSSLDVDVGPLNVKLDSPNHEPTFISFMANNARSHRNFESDAKSITSINSMKSIVSSASVYWMSFSFSKDPRVIQKDVKYLYSSFTKIPCLILSPRTKINSVTGYEEYPCDTSVPLKMFKNIQVLELVEYEPNEVYGWHTLSERLRILIVRNTKVANLAEILHTLVLDDECGRSSFNIRRQPKKPTELPDSGDHHMSNFLSHHPRRAMTASATPTATSSTSGQKDPFSQALSASNNRTMLPANKWFYLKQLTVTESSITQVSGFVFRPLSNLVKLNLSNNLLESLPGGLEYLSSLKYLNLADNYITTLDGLPANLVNIVTINLNNNKLTDISGLETLCALEKIDLRRNKLKDLSHLVPLVSLVANQNSKLNNVFISSNELPKTYRTDLFNLFNGARPKNLVKIDDARPGYFERATLLDPESAKKLYEKIMGMSNSTELSGTTEKFPIKKSSKKNQLNLYLDQPSSDTLATKHKHSKSTGDVLDSLASLNIHDLENSLATRKHTSVMTTASSTTSKTNAVVAVENSGDSGPSSPSVRQFSKSIKPLLPNPNLSNQPNFSSPKMPPMLRQLSSPMIHPNHNGSSSTIRSSNTMTRLDIESVSLNNLAPNVITPVQVQVEGFQ